MVDQNKIAQEWHKKGFSCATFQDPPGQRWEDYTHEVDELFLVLEGNVEIEIAGKKLCPQPGEEILIPAKSLHSVRNIGNMTSRWLYGYKY